MSSSTFVITGATRGLGLALIKRLSLGKCVIAGCGTNTERVEELQKKHPQHFFEVVDVSDAKAVEAWAVNVRNNLPHSPDFLINNAGVINAKANLWEIPADEFDRVIDVNVKGTMNCLRAFLPSMIDAGYGIVVNMSSGWGRYTSPLVGPYCSSKFAIEGLTAALAQELPKTMGAYALNPGIVNTDMLKQAFSTNAGYHQSTDEWVTKALETILTLHEFPSGTPSTVP